MPILGQPHQKMAQKARGMAIEQSIYVTTGALRRLALLIDGRTVKIRVRYVYPLKKVKVTFQLVEEGHPLGNIFTKHRVSRLRGRRH